MTELKLRCKDLSCFYITGHGIDKSLMQSVMDYGRDFFSLSMEKKNAISLEKSAAFRGYIRQGEWSTLDGSVCFPLGWQEGREGGGKRRKEEGKGREVEESGREGEGKEMGREGNRMKGEGK